MLVLGGGDGLATREVLRDPGVRRVDVVELDPGVVRLARTDPALSALNAHAFGDPRVHVFTADAFGWLRGAASTYDVVISDLPDPGITASTKLYSQEFYGLARRVLAPVAAWPSTRAPCPPAPASSGRSSPHSGRPACAPPPTASAAGTPVSRPAPTGRRARRAPPRLGLHPGLRHGHAPAPRPARPTPAYAHAAVLTADAYAAWRTRVPGLAPPHWSIRATPTETADGRIPGYEGAVRAVLGRLGRHGA